MKAVAALVGLSLITLVYLSMVTVVDTACANENLFMCEKSCLSICDTIFDTCPQSGCEKRNPPPKQGGRGKREIGRSVYRNIRDDEDPNVGLTAKDPSAQKSVQSHVGCGCRPNYKSQYISTTASLEVARKYNRNNRIVRINVRVARNNRCKFVDLTDGGQLKGLARNFAKASQEILIYDCTIPRAAITIVA